MLYLIFLVSVKHFGYPAVFKMCYRNKVVGCIGNKEISGILFFIISSIMKICLRNFRLNYTYVLCNFKCFAQNP